MDLSQIPLFAALNKRMAWINERQTVLAENVANVDTPGYSVQDLKEPDFSKLVAGTSEKLPLLTSAPGHLSVTPGSSGAALDFSTFKPRHDRAPNGNNVQLDEQALEVSKNASNYSLMEALYRSQLSLVKMALGSGSSSGGG